MGVMWVQIRSWHAVRVSRSIEPRTFCGRTAAASAEVVDALPAAKSCESCLRILARRADG